MKKLTVMTIVLAILLALTTAVCAAEVEAKVGEEITLEFDLGETAVRTGKYTVKYPSEYLEYVKGSATPCNAENAETAGEVVVAFAGANTTKITLKFKVSKEIEKGKQLNVTMTPDKFVGVDGTKVETAEEKADTVVGAKEVTTYTVKFVDYDGKVLKEEKVEEGKSATAPEDPAREGYKFIRWDKEFSNVTEDLVVTATYEELPQDPSRPSTPDASTPEKPTPSTPDISTPDESTPSEPDGKDDPSDVPTKPDSSNPTPNDEDGTPSAPADEKEEPTTFDKTGVSVAFVGVIALIAIAGAVVLIKRK